MPCAEFALSATLLTHVLCFGVLCHAVLRYIAQITYLQVGASSVTGAWSSNPLKSDSIRVGALFRAEVQRILQALSAGQFTQRDLAAVPQLLANVVGQQSGLLPPPSINQTSHDGQETGAMDAEGGDDATDGKARILMDMLLRKPLGEVLLSYAAVPNSSWGPGPTEYGT